jgi:DNA repair protein RecN (Recombination protein N)
MLQKLYIHNYAIIEELSIEFPKDLVIITGETGAGKSILMGALSMVLGDRAESNIVMNKDRKCVIEASFEVTKNNAVKSFLAQSDLDVDDLLVLRREIAANGKSRSFINDTPVNLPQLKTMSALLVDLHQQFDTLELGNNNFQREILDAVADNTSLLQKYSVLFSEYQSVKKQLLRLQQTQKEANIALDYNQFLFDELEEASFKENELEELDAELKLLSHAEEVKQQLTSIYFDLKENEQPLVQHLKALVTRLHSLTQYHTSLNELNERLQSVHLELDDIAESVDTVNESVQFDPERIQLVNDKISTGYKLLKKHNVTTTNELLSIKTQLQEKLNDILNIGDAINAKEKETASLLKRCHELANIISTNRHEAILPFETKVNALLKQVGMPNAKIRIDIADAAINDFGMDSIMFLFDANLPLGQGTNNSHYEPITKVASGGELSRLMLCVKSLVAQKLQLPTLIFDEIDTGISGEAAKQVGLIMKQLSQSYQVIAITHQPQIAARASAHYFVYKASKAGKISTSIRLLNEEERITAIAQMLGGEKPTAAALQNAREMMSA